MADDDFSGDHPPRPATEPPQELDRCERCGWPLAASIEEGCTRGNCSMRCTCPGAHLEACPLRRAPEPPGEPGYLPPGGLRLDVEDLVRPSEPEADDNDPFVCWTCGPCRVDEDWCCSEFPLDGTAVFRTVTDEHKRQVCEIRCDTCGATSRRDMKPWMPPTAAARFFRRSGWEVDGSGRAAVCPGCMKKPLAATVAERSGLQVVQTTVPIETDASISVRKPSLVVASPPPAPTRDDVLAFIRSELEQGFRHCRKLHDDVRELGGSEKAYEWALGQLDLVFAREQAFQGRIYVALRGTAGERALPGEPYQQGRRQRKETTVSSSPNPEAPKRTIARTQPSPAQTEPAPGPRPEASSSSMRAHRQLYRLLEDHFVLAEVADGSPQIGAYADGWNDERVAAETDLAIEEVVRVRRAAFGDMHDPELEAIRRSQAELREALARLKTERDRFDAAVRATAGSLEQVDAAVRELERRARR